MERIIIALSFIVCLNAQAASDIRVVSRYFKRVPLDKAHLTSGAAREIDFNPQSIKVLVWNIKKTLQVGWEQEFQNYGKDKQLLLLQEAYPNERFTHTTGEHFADFRWDMGISFLYKLYNDLPTGTMIGSKVLPRTALVKQTLDLEPVTETPKAMTIARYPVAGKVEELLVINVHGINFTDHQSFIRNIDQAEEEISQHIGPILIAGDFNTRTNARTDYLFKIMKKHGLSEVKFKNGHLRTVAVMTNNILDFGFVRGLDVKNAEVIGSSVGSDHKPLVMEVAVRD